MSKLGGIIKEMPLDKNETNEEWFCILSTQEKAKVLGQIAKNAYKCCENGKTNKCVNRHNCTGYCDYGWEKWLKEKHETN